MNNLILILVTLFAMCTPAFAGFEGIDDVTSLGIFNRIHCSSGMTCTNSGDGKFTLGAPGDPFTFTNDEELNNTVDDTVEVKSDDEHMTFKITGFEAKDAILEFAADQEDDTADLFSLKADASNVFTLSNGVTALNTVSSTGAWTFIGAILGDGGDALSGFLQAQVASTTASLTAAQCGSTIVSNSADVQVLPEASTVLGCRYSFVCGTADDYDIDPADGTDQIGVINNIAGGTSAVITPSAGDAIRCTDIGSSLTLEAVSANLWVIIGTANGAWTDVN